MDLGALETVDSACCEIGCPSLPEGGGVAFDLPVPELARPIFTEKLLCAEHHARWPRSYKDG